MLSFWERESFLHYDTIIIGSGIVGLSTALSLQEQFPQKSILILERGLMPTGASTRNAGFACFGSLTEILHNIDTMGGEAIFAIIEKRIRGLARLRERVGDAALDYQHVGGYELIFKKEVPALARIDEANELLKPIFGDGVYAERRDLLAEFGFKNVESLVVNPHEGHVHTGKMMRALLKMAGEGGIEIHTGAEVLDINDSPDGAEISVRDAHRGTIVFKSKTAIICTNAFSNHFLPEKCITPGRGQVLVTKPIANLKWRGALHFDEGYYYFRNVGNRVLFGGGRNLAFETEATTDIQPNDTILTELDRLLKTVILPETPYEIDMQWSGIMGFSDDYQPIVRRVSPHVILGFSCNGMGVSLAATIGDEVAGMFKESF